MSRVVAEESVKLTFRVPSRRRDELVAELWVLGTTGLETLAEGEVEVLAAYFGAGAAPSAADREALARSCGAKLEAQEAIAPRDWLAEYRATCSPISIGPLVIDPREPDDAVPTSLDVLRIPARNAFGTGSHESTRLILEALLALDLAGRSVLDVGVGSAILSLAALRRGARHVVGLDIDVGSAVTAGDNGRLNGLRPALFAGTVEALAGQFDVVLVNILPHRWLDSAAAVVGSLRPQGLLLVSGLLAAEAEDVLTPLRTLGASLSARSESGEWACLELRVETSRAL